ncbi:MAG: hypothetical protein PWQ97_1613 [Tepidanaerobacteraceae bacterium]|nr:hypothetical protein [Tepidanaerobacteraceae bacterium]
MDYYENGEQVALLVTAIAIGAFVGLLFDFYRRIRSFITPGPILTALGDLAFWGIVTVVTFFSLFRVNYGEVRGYLFFGLGLGLLLYLSFISRHVIALLLFVDIMARRNINGFLKYLGRLKKLAIFTLPTRIYSDARRIFFKINHKR